jgi:hypothetical protein
MSEWLEIALLNDEERREDKRKQNSSERGEKEINGVEKYSL